MTNHIEVEKIIIYGTYKISILFHHYITKAIGSAQSIIALIGVKLITIIKAKTIPSSHPDSTLFVLYYTSDVIAG